MHAPQTQEPVNKSRSTCDRPTKICYLSCLSGGDVFQKLDFDMQRAPGSLQRITQYTQSNQRDVERNIQASAICPRRARICFPVPVAPQSTETPSTAVKRTFWVKEWSRVYRMPTEFESRPRPNGVAGFSALPWAPEQRLDGDISQITRWSET
ncbi:hypothetical protein M0657_011084 [Pyricularia oryzae]|nr:hypothetical protein M0657_011084 [Pyricularia oryzae]KAI7911173.1 hypothetical protein M9X92_010666 [Pyricularia oryzae]